MEATREAYSNVMSSEIAKILPMDLKEDIEGVVAPDAHRNIHLLPSGGGAEAEAGSLYGTKLTQHQWEAWARPMLQRCAVHAAVEPGFLRKSGSKQDSDALKAQLEEGIVPNWADVPPHTLVSFMKMYLQQLVRRSHARCALRG